MVEITASLVKELRDKTGAGMMDCKKALAETQGNIEDAIAWLRKKGMASADKKAGRTAAEGLVSAMIFDDYSVLVEVNSETDFVARNENFQDFVKNVTKVAVASDGSLEKLLQSDMNGSTVELVLKETIGNIGENLVIRRVVKLHHKGGVASSYVHNSIAENMGQIGVVVILDKQPKNPEFGKQLAMHIAATKPLALSKETLSEEVIAKEKAIQLDIVMQSGKPANIAEKMIEGKMRKYYEDVCLLEQSFIINPDIKVKDALKENDVTIVDFSFIILGEGIEKQVQSFASEVASITGS